MGKERSIVWLLLKRNIGFWICLGIVLFVVLLAIVGPLFAKYGPQETVTIVRIVNASDANRVAEELRERYGLAPADISISMYSIIKQLSNTTNTTELNTLAEECKSQGMQVKIYTQPIPRIECYDPSKMMVVAYIRSKPPSLDFPFGVDKQGYDIFSSTVYGLRVSLSVGVIAAIVATIVGTVLGLLAGYMGGWVDALIDAITNLLIAIPTVFLMLMIGLFYVVGGSAVGREVQNMVFLGLTVGLLSWQWVSRAVRAQVSALKASDFVSVSMLSGNSTIKIIFKDILPNIASYIFLVFVIQLANALGTVVTLEFLGIKAAEWSLFARINQYLMLGEHWSGNWWTLFIPGAIVVAMIASLYLMVLSLEEVFNPRLRKA
ncbi:MAG: ABC transporter permease [Ignisphaera sp.]